MNLATLNAGHHVPRFWIVAEQNTIVPQDCLILALTLLYHNALVALTVSVLLFPCPRQDIVPVIEL